MDVKIFLSVIPEGSLSLNLMFCNQYLHPLDINISHLEHDFPQLESTQETNSIDVFLKINCSKTSWSETSALNKMISKGP